MENPKCAFDLNRFLEAQNLNDVFYNAIKEIESGLKTSHWIWFVYPQVIGLGHSGLTNQYFITSKATKCLHLLYGKKSI